MHQQQVFIHETSTPLSMFNAGCTSRKRPGWPIRSLTIVVGANLRRHASHSRCVRTRDPQVRGPSRRTKQKGPATFAASPFDLAGGLGLRARRQCAPRWGRCGCVSRGRAIRDAPRNRNVIHHSRDVFEPRVPRFVLLAPAHSKMKRPADWRAHSFLAGGLGFEPRLTESESVVLPLDDPPKEPLRGFLQAAP